jgi:hypothetical protein
VLVAAVAACHGCLLVTNCLAGIGGDQSLLHPTPLQHTANKTCAAVCHWPPAPAPAGLRRSGASGASRQTSCFLPTSRPGRRHSCPIPTTIHRPKVGLPGLVCSCVAGWAGGAGLAVRIRAKSVAEQLTCPLVRLLCRPRAWRQAGQVASRQQPAIDAQFLARCRGARQGARRWQRGRQRQGTRSGTQLSDSCPPAPPV